MFVVDQKAVWNGTYSPSYIGCVCEFIETKKKGKEICMGPPRLGVVPPNAW
jgi:hypothetical protein